MKMRKLFWWVLFVVVVVNGVIGKWANGFEFNETELFYTGVADGYFSGNVNGSFAFNNALMVGLTLIQSAGARGAGIPSLLFLC